MSALTTARAYHEAWTTGAYADAAALLAPDVVVEVPVNAYDGRDDFVAAVETFGGMATEIRTLSLLASERDACAIYDMDVPGLGTMRVAEHFEVADGRIVRLRQIHDTHAIRAAGFAG